MSQPEIEMKVDFDGTKYWSLNDKFHREDGPAVEWPNGEKDWYLKGNKVSWREVFKNAKTQEQQVRILCYVSI